FNPSRMLRRTFRNPRKLLAIEAQHAIVGGFNIAPEYAGDGVTRGWFDSGVYAGGPVVASLEQGFAAMLQLAPFTPPAFRRFRRAMRHSWTATLDPDAPVKPLVSGPGLPRGVISHMLRRDLALARNALLASAYFLPSRTVRRLLYHVARGPGRVRL